MKPGCLSEYFDGIAWKRLTAGEIRHQHEINGDRGLRELFGEQKRDVPGRIIFVADTEEDVVEDVGLNWGNRREGKPRAPEWRLYYTPNSVMGERVIGGEIQVTRAETGDSIFVARSSDRVRIDLIVAPRESTVELQLLWLFGIGMAEGEEWLIRPESGLDERTLDEFARRFLARLGIEPEVKDANLEALVEQFTEWPARALFSRFARDTLPEMDVLGDPDQSLCAWYEREYALFRVLERRLLGDEIRAVVKAGADFDRLLKACRSAFQRRSSRAGGAFEDHLAELFRRHRLKFDRGAVTEARKRPDFLFPGGDEYHRAAKGEFRVELLTLLGAKTTAKDRWRQITTEGALVASKHLVTLEPAISAAQLREMQGDRIQLVVPMPVLRSYDRHPSALRDWIWPVERFLVHVKTQQQVLEAR